MSKYFHRLEKVISEYRGNTVTSVRAGYGQPFKVSTKPEKPVKTEKLSGQD